MLWPRRLNLPSAKSIEPTIWQWSFGMRGDESGVQCCCHDSMLLWFLGTGEGGEKLAATGAMRIWWIREDLVQGKKLRWEARMSWECRWYLSSRSYQFVVTGSGDFHQTFQPFSLRISLLPRWTLVNYILASLPVLSIWWTICLIRTSTFVADPIWQLLTNHDASWNLEIPNFGIRESSNITLLTP